MSTIETIRRRRKALKCKPPSKCNCAANIFKIQINRRAIISKIKRRRSLVLGAGPGDCNDFFASCCNCCGGTIPCCNWPDTLTVTTTSECVNVDGQTVTINYDSGLSGPSYDVYHGEITLSCGDELWIDLYVCISGSPSAAGVVCTLHNPAHGEDNCLTSIGGTCSMDCGPPPSLGPQLGYFWPSSPLQCECGCLTDDNISIEIV